MTDLPTVDPPASPGEAWRVCVLGGGGFLGSHLVAALLEQTPHRVEVVDQELAKLTTHSDRLVCRRESIESPGLLDQVTRDNQVIISTTALCNPSQYNTRPADVIHASFSHLVPLVDLCTQQNRRLIHFSTCEVYGRGEGENGAARKMSEEDTPLVLGPVSMERWSYACAKQLLERLIWAKVQHDGLSATIVRPFNVIGPRMDYLPGLDGEGIPRVVACFMRALLFGEPLTLVGGGRNRRSFLYVSDFVQGVLRILARPEACDGQIINLGNPAIDIPIRELAERMADCYRSLVSEAEPVRFRSVGPDDFYGPGYDDSPRRIPDIAKAERLLGWTPTTTLDEMLPPIIRDYIAHYGRENR